MAPQARPTATQGDREGITGTVKKENRIGGRPCGSLCYSSGWLPIFGINNGVRPMTMKQELEYREALIKIDSIMDELLTSLDASHHKGFFDGLDKAIQKQKSEKRQRARDVLKTLREKRRQQDPHG
jgi:hypothetical protein